MKKGGGGLSSFVRLRHLRIVPRWYGCIMPSVSGHARFIRSGEEETQGTCSPSSTTLCHILGVGIIMHDLVERLIPFEGLNVHETKWGKLFPSSRGSPSPKHHCTQCLRSLHCQPRVLLALPVCLLWRPHKLRPHGVGSTSPTNW
jgi:hypothetical protein